MTTALALHGLTDEQLLTAARNHDEDALAELYARYYPSAVRFARSLRGSDAEDAVSEAFFRVLGQLRRGAGPDRNFRGYLFQAVRNVHLNTVRASARTSALPFGDHSILDRVHRQDHDQDSPELLDLVNDEFTRLTKREQHALWLTIIEGLSLAEASLQLQTTQGAAGALVYRARNRLRRALSDKLFSSAGNHLVAEAA